MASRPRGFFKSSTMPRLLRLLVRKIAPMRSSTGGGPAPRTASPPGDSTLMTSAPRSPSIWVATGPSRMVVRSTTRIPTRGPFDAWVRSAMKRFRSRRACTVVQRTSRSSN